MRSVSTRFYNSTLLSANMLAGSKCGSTFLLEIKSFSILELKKANKVSCLLDDVGDSYFSCWQIDIKGNKSITHTKDYC
ncbi:hypothetical protein PPL_07054 [Heterostelium album PN500]|uniref:Uncharacterized protein n=1 Tax=Heterostelium pallidum (strain ATCC 26659 / Pp 5 / PN500) TaxID=670386 RepID=D3BE98_HETP5|nr:hypothetical protein PPL_07054 [Heterostelium album PN500]EFA80229.1 hypothetical protein PPL_07054 [Heterostelium album PN500]|eukprot:XP_020432349.1 hypothetical protein PPL_07054 [Heterostelium album PN500]